ncbi:MAG: hypothetical protein ABJD53_06035 [Gammaproteobacteria bacterium]
MTTRMDSPADTKQQETSARPAYWSGVFAMSQPKPIRYLTLAIVAICLSGCSKGPGGQARTAIGSGAAAGTLQVDAQRWPVDLLELAQSATNLAQARAGSVFLTQIDIDLPDVHPPATSVDYTFYAPQTRKRFSVTYLNTDVSLPPDQMKMAQQAGVADVMMRAQEAVLLPQLDELPTASGHLAPIPLQRARIELRDAYALARQSGLVRAEHVSLSMDTKDPASPLLLWNFQGKYTREDSQGIHIDALTGALVDEDRINDLSRAERSAQLEKGFDALKSLTRARGSAAGQTSPGLTPGGGSGSPSNDNTQACQNRGGTMHYDNCDVYHAEGSVRIDPQTGAQVAQ